MNNSEQVPETAEAYNNRGDARRKKGDLDGALSDFNKAIELKPDFAIAYNNRAFANQAKGEFSSSLADYDRAITLKPNRPLQNGVIFA